MKRDNDLIGRRVKTTYGLGTIIEQDGHGLQSLLKVELDNSDILTVSLICVELLPKGHYYL